MVQCGRVIGVQRQRRVHGLARSLIIVIAGVVIITEGQRSIPVSYAKRVRGNRMLGGVCGGLGSYLGIDPTFVRIFFFILIMGLVAFFFITGIFEVGDFKPAVQATSSAINWAS